MFKLSPVMLKHYITRFNIKWNLQSNVTICSGDASNNGVSSSQRRLFKMNTNVEYQLEVFFPCPVLWDQPLKLLVDIHVVDETQQTPTIDHFTVIGLMA